MTGHMLPRCNLGTGQVMPHKLLTDRFVAGVRPSEGVPQVDYFDQGHPALALRVGHRDKVWTFHYRDNGRLRRAKLGRYPEMTLAEAREAWRLARKALADGTFGRSSVPGSKVETVVAEWLKSWRQGKAANSISAVESQLRIDILP